MECHLCLHREDMESGKYRHVAFEKTPCASCQLEEKSGSTFEFKEDRGTDEPRGVVETSDDLLPISVLKDFISQLLNLPPTLRDVVCWRYDGFSYTEIARFQCVTAATAEKRQRRAMEMWPALRAMFIEKAEKQKRRKLAEKEDVRNREAVTRDQDE